ncbi:MAG: polymer-forming cytoskeletal protein [Sphingomonadaceae bacterium]
MARTPSGSGTFSVIGADVTIAGNINASADLHIDGRIEGDIACASLVQGESAEIHGAINAETARLAGRVVGSITARELVILQTARIEGDVHYDALTIEQGAEVEGRFAHRLLDTAGQDSAQDHGGPRPGEIETVLSLASEN